MDGQEQDGSWFGSAWEAGKRWTRDNGEFLMSCAETAGPPLVQAVGRGVQSQHPVTGAFITSTGTALELAGPARRAVMYVNSAVKTGSTTDTLKAICATVQVGTSLVGGTSYLPGTSPSQAYPRQAVFNFGKVVGFPARGETKVSKQESGEPILPVREPIPTPTMPPSRLLPNCHDSQGQTRTASQDDPAYPVPNYSRPLRGKRTGNTVTRGRS